MHKLINSFLLKGVFRAPCLPYSTIKKTNRKEIKELVKTPLFMEAILTTSPSFYEELLKWSNGNHDEGKEKRIFETLYKYVVRMSARSTPFGMMSSVGHIAFIAQEKEGAYQLANTIHANFRLDSVLIGKIVNWFNKQPEIEKRIGYKANNTIYFAGDALRYFEPSLIDKKIEFDLTKVARIPFLEEVLDYCKHNAYTIPEIAEHFCDERYSKEEIQPFLEDLVTARILMSDLSLKITQPNYIKILLSELNKILKATDGPIFERYKDLTAIQKTLTSSSLSVNEKWTKTQGLLEAFDFEIDLKDILQIDTKRNLRDEQAPKPIKKNVLADIEEVREILLRLTKKPVDKFKQFKIDFRRRYGNRQMPLLNVIDPESGIGFNQVSEMGDDLPLINGLSFQDERKRLTNINLSYIEIYLLRKMQQAGVKNEKEIELSLNELTDFPIQEAQNSQSVRFSLIDEGKKARLYEFSHASGNALISRFSYLDERIKNVCEEVNKYENEQYKLATIAEIVHLPELKSGNIILHEKIRAIEIPCIVASENKNMADILFLKDILVRVDEDDKLLLFSEKTGKRIIPRLSNALNYDRDGIDVFRFLAEIQFDEGVPFIAFNWYNLLLLSDYFPRITFKSLVVSPAIWLLSKHKLNLDEDFERTIKEWRRKNSVPQLVNIASNPNDDSQLLIDFDNPLAVAVFKTELEKNERLCIMEFDNSNSPFSDNNTDNSYLNEVVLPFLKNKKHKTYQLKKIEDTDFIHNQFLPGSKWLYFKIYVGHIMSDHLLVDQIKSLSEKLIEEGVIKKWFFIRYSDGDYHIRLRLLLTESEKSQTVIKSVKTCLKNHYSNDIIHNVTIDTYKREIDRYGVNTMDQCETIFHYDSASVCTFLSTENAIDNNWIFGALGVDSYLNNFEFDLEKRIKLIGGICNAFMGEFNISKKQKLDLDKKYREYRLVLFESFRSFGKFKNLPKSEMQEIIDDRTRNIDPIIKSIQEKLTHSKALKQEELALSLIHMFLNRLFTSNHRKQEMALYYMMYKHYQAIKAINNN